MTINRILDNVDYAWLKGEFTPFTISALEDIGDINIDDFDVDCEAESALTYSEDVFEFLKESCEDDWALAIDEGCTNPQSIAEWILGSEFQRFVENYESHISSLEDLEDEDENN